MMCWGLGKRFSKQDKMVYYMVGWVTRCSRIELMKYEVSKVTLIR